MNAVIRIDAASGTTMSTFDQIMKLNPVISTTPSAVATVAQSAESIGIRNESATPPNNSSSTSAPSMYAGFCFRLCASIPAIMLACISTPG